MLFILIALNGCSNNEGEGSYQSIINVNGTKYFLLSDKGPTYNGITYEKGKKIGEIQYTVSIDHMPDIHLTSNHLEKGSKLFMVIDKEGYILVEPTDTNDVFLYTLEENISSVD